ncbi:MAG: GYD domain-containing protein [Proteobacteria bacterium]|nr:GYD domain-containing protein [Pseudomonadota bacterium]
MPLYIMLSNLTSEGLETIKKKPERILEVEQELREMGVVIKGQWAVLGEYDFVNLVEAPDNETVARASVEVGSRGSVSLVTMPAIPVRDFIESMKQG